MNKEEQVIQEKVQSGSYHAPSELGAVVLVRDLTEEQKNELKAKFLNIDKNEE